MNMLKRLVCGFGCLIILLGLIQAWPARAAALSLSLNSFAIGLSSPVGIVHSGVSGDTRLFVVERAGRIKIVQNDGTVLALSLIHI